MIEFRFAHPLALLLLLIMAILLLTWRRESGRRSAPPVMSYSDVRLLTGLSRSWRVRYRRLPDALRLTAWILLVIALARPQSGRAQEVIRGQGIDIVMALDISGSMATLDFQPNNRLQAAKSVISDFIKGREFDQMGLVVFARNAFHQAPLTLDYDVLLALLDEVRLVTELGLEDGTALGLGLASAANMLRSSEAVNKVIIMLTDGENNTALDPIAAAQAATTLGIRVYAIGMGKAGSPELNEETLRKIATITNGLYFRAEALTDLQQIYNRIDALERSDVTRQVFVRWQDQAAGWLIVGLSLMLLERILRHTLFQTVP